MMAKKCTIKLKLVMMMFIILIILEVHANNPTHISSAPTPPPTNLKPFQLDFSDRG